MPSDPRKRQKKLERRAAQRSSKKHLVAKQQSAGLATRLEAAAKYPVVHSCITESLWEEGLGWVLFSRQVPDGSVATTIFLVDTKCLGVKRVIMGVFSRFAYDCDYAPSIRTKQKARDLPPATLRKLVEESVAYAENVGIHPLGDVAKAMLLFGDVKTSDSTETFEFGDKGKPMFIGGPNDTPQSCKRIINTLERHCGKGGYNFMIPMVPGNGMLNADEGLEELSDFDDRLLD